ncbi:hypothetical protein BKA82DRAFT_4011013 [Pisolithus tinctorius]|nr:hypothetical protein BKA82DRAFT_4011013 [Pisolithus tinctorius]
MSLVVTKHTELKIAKKHDGMYQGVRWGKYFVKESDQGTVHQGQVYYGQQDMNAGQLMIWLISPYQGNIKRTVGLYCILLSLLYYTPLSLGNIKTTVGLYYISQSLESKIFSFM